MRRSFATYAVLLATIFMAGCTTAFQRADGSYDVPRNVEVRSPFGTNAGFVKLEHCAVKVDAVSWSNPLGLATYTGCHGMKNWVPTSSQGQGGQVAAGAMIGLGFGLGAAFAPTSSTSASSASNSTAIAGKGGHH